MHEKKTPLLVQFDIRQQHEHWNANMLNYLANTIVLSVHYYINPLTHLNKKGARKCMLPSVTLFDFLLLPYLNNFLLIPY